MLGVALKSRKETKIDYDDLVLSKDNSSGNTCACEISLSKALIMSIVGIIGIVLGGKLVVDCASDIAMTFGVSEKMIGLTIVSIGTSLPEFVTSVIAASKGESDIALGNVIGSNVFNILFILGLSSLISPIPVDPSLFFDIAIMILITIVTYLFSIRKKDVNKFESIILIAAYAIYMMLVIFKV